MQTKQLNATSTLNYDFYFGHVFEAKYKMIFCILFFNFLITHEFSFHDNLNPQSNINDSARTRGI